MLCHRAQHFRTLVTCRHRPRRPLISLGSGHTLTGSYDTSLSPSERKRAGAWYTPPELVAHVVREAVGVIPPGGVVRVLDPACGDGRFLFEAARVIEDQGGIAELTGVDIDSGGLGSVRHPHSVEAIHANALSYPWRSRRFDLVLGNPPFLSQMASATARVGRSAFGGGPYADAAADFLALAVQLARPNGGRVGLVLPLSILTARDAGSIRADVLRNAAMQWFWSSPDRLFEAMVHTCAIGFQRGAPTGDGGGHVTRTVGASFDSATPVHADSFNTANSHWGALVADSLGLPPAPPVSAMGTVADHGLVTANFRDQYYGLVGCVSDEAPGPPLVTTGLIDVACCHWGARPTRFAKEQFAAPRVDVAKLAPFMRRWADRCLVPKVLVATQTRVLEAVADDAGAWLPAVPVVRVVPTEAAQVWAVAAVLTSPVASALIAAQSAGSGLSASTFRVSQRTLQSLAWPEGDLAEAITALRDDDALSCGRAVDAAYGVHDESLFAWWQAAVSSRR